MLARAHEIIRWCRRIAECTEEPGRITRTFLSEPMREVHALLSEWMRRIGMQVRVDAAGNLRGTYAGTGAHRLLIGSHLDTVRNAGAFDGILGVVLGIMLVEALEGERLPIAIELVGFSEEEGVRFGTPFLGSRALAGTLDPSVLELRDSEGVSVAEAIRGFGLDISRLSGAEIGPEVIGYLEFHIEQGPVLESQQAPLGVVEGIAGQSRMMIEFQGAANHAGTTPMLARRDALAAAAEWISFVEQCARETAGLVATVGRLQVEPNASNVIPGLVRASLDVRHGADSVRRGAVEALSLRAHQIAEQRGLALSWRVMLDQPAVRMNLNLEVEAPRIISGAGHDAMILAAKVPAAMVFLRSPGGVSHSPEETVNVEDVAVALTAGLGILKTQAVAHV